MAESRKYVNYHYHSIWTNAIKGYLSAKQYAPMKVLDIINKIDDDTGCLDFKVWHFSFTNAAMYQKYKIRSIQEFCYVLSDVYNHDTTEQGYKEAFRVFSKDEEGAIPAEEIKYFLLQCCSFCRLS